MNFSESQFDGGSPAVSANRDTSGLIPLTVKQISEASHSGDDKSKFSVSGADVINVSVVGMVLKIVERKTDSTFTIDDGTGKLECKRWLNEDFDRLQMQEVREGIYVHVDGHLKSFKGEKHVVVFSVRPVTSFDEITFHFISCIHNHIRTSKLERKIQGEDVNMMNSTPKTPIQNATNYGFMSTQSSQIPSVALDFDGVAKGSTDQMVYAFLQANFGIEKGIHIDEIKQKLKLPIDKIRESVTALEDEGQIYPTIDEFHFKAVQASNGI